MIEAALGRYDPRVFDPGFVAGDLKVDIMAQGEMNTLSQRQLQDGTLLGLRWGRVLLEQPRQRKRGGKTHRNPSHLCYIGGASANGRFPLCVHTAENCGTVNHLRKMSMQKRISPGAMSAFWFLGFLFPALAAAQDKRDDPALVHVRMYKRIAPSVVLVSGGAQKGSGVIIDKDGIILTSPTACGQSTTTVTVTTKGFRRLTGTVIGRVNELELVVVKVDARDLPAVELGDSDHAQPGALTYVFGDSFQSIEIDDQPAMSVGVLSSVYDVKARRSGGSLYSGPVIETSCAVNPNQDGGPLLDSQGRLIGLITLNYSDAKFTGIAVPINRLKPEIDRILLQYRNGVARQGERTTGKREQGWMGVEVENSDEVRGLRITRLFHKGPAEQGGLRRGDIIRKINDTAVANRGQFEDAFKLLQVGAQVRLRVDRDGEELDLVVTLGKKTYY